MGCVGVKLKCWRVRWEGGVYTFYNGDIYETLQIMQLGLIRGGG